MTATRVIGYQNAIPWHVPADLKLFRQLTIGKPIIMGRKTFESIGRPLPKRHNLVVSRSLAPQAGITVLPSLEAALKRAAELAEHSCIIGGAAIYQAAMPIADELAVSWIPGEYPGDRYFPAIDPAIWRSVERQPYPGFLFERFARR